MQPSSRSPSIPDLRAWHACHAPLSVPLQRAYEGLDLPLGDAVLESECCVVLDLLATLDCDDATLAAVLNFACAQTLDDAAARKQWLESLDAQQRGLVEGQLAAVRVWTLHAERGGGSEGLRRLLLAIIRDLRVVFILLARQLARMRAAASLPADQRRALAALTADIHAPLANRLGIWQLKWELEDLAFRYLQPDIYKRIARLLHERRVDREVYIAECIRRLGDALAEAGIRAEVAGRPKHIYSIWRKMQRKGLEFSELYDIRAVRVLVPDLSACYAALGLVHALWPYLPGEFDDYVARPKGNRYQSLHTAVVGPDGRTLEVQIRSHAMHQHAELGVAAHWNYKEGGAGQGDFEAKVAWMRKLLDARSESEEDNDTSLMADFRAEIIEDRIYLLTPRGEVIDLPRGATVLDFAYHIHTEVGHRCRGAKVNGRIVPLVFQPRSGDRVEILTGKQAEPSRDWLSDQQGYLHSGRARDKVRAWFRRVDHHSNLAAGRALLDRELKRLALTGVDLAPLPGRLGMQTLDEVLVALAIGDVSSGQVARALTQPETTSPELPERAPRPAPPRDPAALTIDGVGNLMTQLARCCQPLPGDAVAGFITRGRGVSVHRVDCAKLARLREREPARVIEVQWGQAGAQAYAVEIQLRAYDRKTLHKDVATVINHFGLPIVAASSRTLPSRGEVHMRYTLRVSDYEQLSGLLGRLSSLPNVFDVRRLSGG